MTEVSGQAEAVAVRLGLKAGDVVGEIGYDDDVDHDLREAVEGIIGSELLDEDADDVLDAVILWWREEDGDLTDALVDAITLLADTGVIWLLTPKTGSQGYVEPSDIAEATRTAGLAQTTTVPGGLLWMTAKLARAKQGRIRR
ncbi:DUF3052 domain-containing protein [Nakamurella sp. PAMC28650]|uniref:DUF3052 domain-containing protein n=1 Tax=Nakamurella sp. PAMC28650 TaxID=2762325 RepID=UPI00164ECCE7|nr:DUF3052 domain-containing protein [Nakamurella sp. PAMC28650]QNK80178.1 DUF3052 domain-containing protein [Nakamurella sp. PAMC28650]